MVNIGKHTIDGIPMGSALHPPMLPPTSGWPIWDSFPPSRSLRAADVGTTVTAPISWCKTKIGCGCGWGLLLDTPRWSYVAGWKNWPHFEPDRCSGFYCKREFPLSVSLAKFLLFFQLVTAIRCGFWHDRKSESVVFQLDWWFGSAEFGEMLKTGTWLVEFGEHMRRQIQVLVLMSKFEGCTLPKTNIAPENGWLEY